MCVCRVHGVCARCVACMWCVVCGVSVCENSTLSSPTVHTLSTRPLRALQSLSTPFRPLFLPQLSPRFLPLPHLVHTLSTALHSHFQQQSPHSSLPREEIFISHGMLVFLILWSFKKLRASTLLLWALFGFCSGLQICIEAPPLGRDSEPRHSTPPLSR